MAEERKKLPTFTTPKGVAKWATLNKPDTKFKKEGEYRVTLLLSQEDADPIIKKIEQAISEAKAVAKADPKNKGKKLKDADLPYKQDINKEGEETGLIAFNFKAKASGERKDGTTWTFRPIVYDSKGKPVGKNIVIFGGSTVKVAYQLNPYATAIGVGVSLKMTAVQVIELKTLGEKDFSSYGFGEEEGYVAEEEEGSAAEGGEAGASDSAAEENPDF